METKSQQNECKTRSSENPSSVGKEKTELNDSTKPQTNGTQSTNRIKIGDQNGSEANGNKESPSMGKEVTNANHSPAAAKKTVQKAWRVKLYQLKENGVWDDKGTGYVQCQYLESVNGTAIRVISEQDVTVEKVLLESKVVNENIYNLQGKTIITWTEPGVSQDLALSFQDEAGCQDIWEKMCSAQGRVASDFHEELSASYRGGDYEEASQNSDRTLVHSDQTLKELPVPSFKTLDDILKILGCALNSNYVEFKDHYAAQVLKQCSSEKDTADVNGQSDRNTATSEKNIVKRVATNKVCDKDMDSRDSTRTKRLSSESSNGVDDLETTWLAKLLSLFSDLEDLENIKSLHTLYSIVKFIALLNDTCVYEALLDDVLFNSVVGVLEYDPDLQQKAEHRKFIGENVTFKQVVPISDPETLQKIHQKFRIAFLRDVLLPRALDEPSFNTLSSMDKCNSVEITTALQADDKFMTSLFKLLRDKSTPREKREQVVSFLQELCSLAKQLQVHQCNAYYRTLLEKGEKFFDIFNDILADSSSSPRERLMVTDILMLSLEHDSCMLRGYILNEKNHPPPLQEGTKYMDIFSNYGASNANGTSSILFQLMHRLIADSEAGMQAQAFEVLRFLLDPETMEVSEKDQFLTVFYDHYMQYLIVPLESVGEPIVNGSELELDEGQQDSANSESNGYTLNFVSVSKNKSENRLNIETARVADHYICELLSFCVQTHGYRIKYFILRGEVVMKVLQLLQCREKHLILDAVRFIRTCVGLKDHFYNRYFAKHDLFSEIFAVFQRNGPRNNLINSAIIELLEFIQTESVDILVNYIVEKYSSTLKNVNYVATFDKLVELYKKNTEASRNSENKTQGERSDGPRKLTNRTVNSRFGEQRALEEDDDDAFFNEEESTNVTSNPDTSRDPSRKGTTIGEGEPWTNVWNSSSKNDQNEKGKRQNSDSSTEPENTKRAKLSSSC